MLDFPRPSNDKDFENFCVRYFRKLGKNDRLQLYAKRGQKQDGIDIHDPLGISPAIAVQCKLIEVGKKLKTSDLETETSKASNSVLPVNRYVIATTASTSRECQDWASEFNQKSGRKFTLEILFWESICHELSCLSLIERESMIQGRDMAREVIGEICINPQLRSTVALLFQKGNDSPEADFSNLERLMEERKFEIASYELSKLAESEHWETTGNYWRLALVCSSAVGPFFRVLFADCSMGHQSERFRLCGIFNHS